MSGVGYPRYAVQKSAFPVDNHRRSEILGQVLQGLLDVLEPHLVIAVAAAGNTMTAWAVMSSVTTTKIAITAKTTGIATVTTSAGSRTLKMKNANAVANVTAV